MLYVFDIYLVQEKRRSRTNLQMNNIFHLHEYNLTSGFDFCFERRPYPELAKLRPGRIDFNGTHSCELLQLGLYTDCKEFNDFVRLRIGLLTQENCDYELPASTIG